MKRGGYRQFHIGKWFDIIISRPKHELMIELFIHAKERSFLIGTKFYTVTMADIHDEEGW